MCCKGWKSILPFALTFLVGIFISVIFHNIWEKGFIYEELKDSPESALVKSSSEIINPMIITSAPTALYTDMARQNKTEGMVILEVVFLADGKIGHIQVLSGLPNGLTDQAIIAANQIKFNPQTNDGIPQTVIKPVKYSFKF